MASIQKNMASKYPSPRREGIDSTTTSTTPSTTTVAPSPPSRETKKKIFLISFIGAILYVIIALPALEAYTSKTFGIPRDEKLTFIHGVVFFIIAMITLYVFRDKINL